VDWLIDLRPCQHDNGYMDGRSQIKVHKDERTQFHISAQSSLVVTHPSTNRARCYLTSVTESRTKQALVATADLLYWSWNILLYCFSSKSISSSSKNVSITRFLNNILMHWELFVWSAEYIDYTRRETVRDWLTSACHQAMDGRSLIKAHTDERTQVHMQRSVLFPGGHPSKY